MIHSIRVATFVCATTFSTLFSLLPAYGENQPSASSTLTSDVIESSSSSSASLPTAPSNLLTEKVATGGVNPMMMGKGGAKTSVKPFSSLALAVKLGVAGIGFDVATPLSKHLNLRGGASFFSYSPNLNEDGITATGTLTFRSVTANVDYFPFKGSFHLSPGVTLYNGNKIIANASVAGGSSFELNNVDYTSANSNPIQGIFDVKLGNQVAPSFTIGWGNMIPRGGGHWSVPFEIGFQYVSSPVLTLNLTGSTVQNGVTVNTATDPNFQANEKAEQASLQSDINALQIYPILSIGVGYKF